MKTTWAIAAVLACVACEVAPGAPSECIAPFVNRCHSCAPIDRFPEGDYQPACTDVTDWVGAPVPECVPGATEPCWRGEIDEEKCPFSDEHFYLHILNNGEGASEFPSSALCTIPDCDKCFQDL